MAQELKKVEPGDLIASDLMNLIIDELLDLEAKVAGMGGTGTVTVPSLFGMTLDSAQSLISQPQFKMNMGSVLDAYGTLLNAGENDAKQRLVINQYPVPGARVGTGAFVNLLVGAKPSAGGGGTTTPPAVKLNSFNPAKAHIGEQVTLIGENFYMLDITKNVVTIGGVKAAPPTSMKSTELNVVVPDIPEPPTGTAEKPVSVKVENPNGTASLDLLVLAKREGVPTLTNMTKDTSATPATIFAVGSIVKINGTNFSSESQKNVVTFGKISTTPESTGNTTSVLRVRVPLVEGLTQNVEGSVLVNVFVTSNGIKSQNTLTNITIAVPAPE
jgi:hypothetical protein